MLKHLLISIFFSLFLLPVVAQKKTATVAGRVVDENDQPLSKVTIIILGRQSGQASSDSGTFQVRVPADKAFALVFSYAGYRTEQRNFYLSEGEAERVIIRMEKTSKTLEEVVVSSQPERRETGLVRVNPRNALVIPSTIGGVESLIKIFVGSNN
jgi:hypothetical protein